MGMEDRDWYRDWWRKKQGHVERARFRVPLEGVATDPDHEEEYPYGRPTVRKAPQFHWTIQNYRKRRLSTLLTRAAQMSTT